RELHAAGVARATRLATLTAVGAHQLPRTAGALLGSRADALPPWARSRLSLERRSSFSPVDFG
ncbi:MAG: hypothetical protein WAU77_05970, partial [Solirubrobacteraceae bacterium]